MVERTNTLCEIYKKWRFWIYYFIFSTNNKGRKKRNEINKLLLILSALNFWDKGDFDVYYDSLCDANQDLRDDIDVSIDVFIIASNSTKITFEIIIYQNENSLFFNSYSVIGNTSPL